MNFIKLTFSFLCIFIFASCKAPDVAVSTLGKKLASPQLKSGTASPFDQDLESTGYVRIQGVCDVRIGEISMSFDNTNWVVPPINPDTTGVTGLSGVVNDVNCSDGSFDFYLTKKDLLDKWGIQAGDNGTQVDAIYIRGESLIGYTHVLKINNNDHSGGPATMLSLKKWHPQGFAGNNRCEAIYIQAVNASGHSARLSEAVEVNLGVGPALTQASVYSNFADCESGANARPTISLPAGQSSFELIYRFPSTGSSISLNLMNPTKLVIDPNPLVLTLRSAESGSVYRWLSVSNPFGNIYKGLCYEIEIQAHRYDGTPANDTEERTINLSSDNAGFKYYSNIGCTAAITEVQIPGDSWSAKAYVKYTPSGSESGNFTSAALQMAVAPSGNNYTYDYVEQRMGIDLSSSAVPTRLVLQAYNQVGSGYCTMVTVLAQNDNSTILNFGANRTLAITFGGAATEIYSDAACENHISSPKTVSNEMSYIFYFKPTATAPSYKNINVATSGLETGSLEMYVSVPDGFFMTNVGNLQLDAAPNDSAVGLVTITNKHWGSVGPVTIEVSTRPDVFVVEAVDPGCLMSMAPNASCEIRVTATADTIGVYNTELLVTSSLPAASIPISLSVVGPTKGSLYNGGIYAGTFSEDGRKLIVSRGGCDVLGFCPGADTTPQLFSSTSPSVSNSDVQNGRENAEQLNSSEYTAAKFCADLSIEGYDDWYLPASQELYEALNALSTVSPGWPFGFKEGAYYWSSTIYPSNLIDVVTAVPVATHGVNYATGDTYVRCMRTEP